MNIGTFCIADAFDEFILLTGYCGIAFLSILNMHIIILFFSVHPCFSDATKTWVYLGGSVHCSTLWNECFTVTGV